ncbi:MAG: hypothetical protein JO016_10785, partial [Actinobacteria bacterium]|nr:hypothetical protein [Actinomycetota bacterium]
AQVAVDRFAHDLASRNFSATTCRIRRRYLEEFLAHAQQGAGEAQLTVAELMEPERADAWLVAAADGQLRTRNTRYGPQAAVSANSIRVRVGTYNAFAQFLGLGDRRHSPPPARGFHLTPGDTERLLHDLTIRRPSASNLATTLRTAAVAALVADTGQGVPELAALKVSDLHLNNGARVDVGGESYPLTDATVQILSRWLSVRAEIVAELQGTDPGHLWVPTKPGRPRGGQPPIKPGLNRAAVRTLHAAHRTLVSQLLGAPLRPGALRDFAADALAGPSAAATPAGPDADGRPAQDR